MSLLLQKVKTGFQNSIMQKAWMPSVIFLKLEEYLKFLVIVFCVILKAHPSKIAASLVNKFTVALRMIFGKPLVSKHDFDRFVITCNVDEELSELFMQLGACKNCSPENTTAISYKTPLNFSKPTITVIR